MNMSLRTHLSTFAVIAALALGPLPASAATTLLNVSYDPTRELYQDYNAAFAKYWKAKGGQDVQVRQSHGGSGKQARSENDRHETDEETHTQANENEANTEKGQILPKDWQKRLPNNSAPYTST